MILVIGEAIADIFIAEKQPGRIRMDALPGGSPFNVAIGLGRLEAPAAFLATIGADPFGDMLREALKKAGVDDRFVSQTDGGTALSVVTTRADGQPLYAFYPGADRLLKASHLPTPLPPDIRVIACGSYTLGLEPFSTALHAFLTREKGQRVISIDPNARAHVLDDVAAFSVKIAAFLDLADVVKISREDIDLLYGAETAHKRLASGWLEKGAKLVIVTHGADGVEAFTKTRRMTCPAARVAVQDTVGAGDSFHAALLAFLDREGKLTLDALAKLTENELKSLLEVSVKAAGITCSRTGADLPFAKEVFAS